MENDDLKVEFDAVLNTVVDGVVIIDSVGIMRLFNPACEKMFGYACDDVLGQNVNMLMPQPFHDAHDGYLKAYADTGERKIIGIGREAEGLRKDGTVFPIELSIGETTLDGEPIFIGVLRDITRRREAENKYEKLQDEHFRLARIASMNEMGSAIAHELNQPLTASTNYLETLKLLLNKEEDIDLGQLTRIIEQAVEQTHRASDIITRMRRFIERGEVERSPCAIQDVIDKCLRLTSVILNARDIKIKTHIDKNIRKVMINEVQIQQVLINLINNAVDALEGCADKALFITAAAIDENYVQVSVGDTGRGISDGFFEKLFTPFSSQTPGGIGVGLSISKSIIDNYGGQIWAEQNKPAGSTFHFTLPICG